MRTFFIGGEFSEKDLGLLKNFFMEKYGKIISPEAFGKFLMLSASQLVSFEKGENPFLPKTTRYFNGPFLDIDVDINPDFSIKDDVYSHFVYPCDQIYASVRGDYINDEYFPQESFRGANSTARFQIVSTKEDSDLRKIINLAGKEMKRSKNLSKFAIRVLHDIALNNPKLLEPFKDMPIIIPLKSKKKEPASGYPFPLFSVRESDLKFIWDFSWDNVDYPEGYYVVLLSQK